jgi:hypothetical protein
MTSSKPLQVAFRRRQHAGRAGHRLDDDRGDGRRVVQGDDAFEIVGEMRAPVRLALREGLLGAIVGRRQMVDAGQQRAEEFPVADDAADRDAAEADAVVAALAPDQAGARAFAADVVVGEGDLQRGVDRFRSGVAEEHVIEVGRRQRRDPARQLERLRMRELERRRVVELGGLRADRRDDRIAIVSRVRAPKSGGAVEHRASVGCVVVHVLRAGDQPRSGFERAIGREREPVGLQVVRDCRRTPR